jgi:elongation factor G
VNTYAADKIRNVALAGHSSTGKTSLAEAMLFSAGATNRLGSVDDGSTRSDYTEAEVSRKISISTSLLYCEWQSAKINILDAPGYADFIGDAKGALWATDSAIVLVDAANGVEIGTDKAWGFAEAFGRPVLFYINHMDKEFADFDAVLEGLREHYGHGVVPFQLPANQGVGFNQIADVLSGKLIAYPEDGSGKPAAEDLPDALREQVETLREQIIEGAAESEDSLTEKYLEEGELSDEELARGLATGIANRTLFPVLCGDASRNIGTAQLLDFIVRQMPSPEQMPPKAAYKGDGAEELQLPSDADGPLAAAVFKTISESVGDLSFVRVYSGTLRPGEDVLNSSRKVNERIGQVYSLNGHDRKEVASIPAGDMGALIKLKDTHTGNVICGRRDPLDLGHLEFPHPLIRIALQPKSRGDEDKISTGLQRIHEEDPSFVAGYDPELRQIIAQGQGELHLDVVLGKLKQKFGVEVERIEPRIPYRETITSKGEGHHRHKKQTGGRGQFGEVYVRIEPKARGEGYEFSDEIVGGAIPRNFIPAVEKGVVEAMERGVQAGYKSVDLKVSIYDGSFHPVDSSEMAFKLAGSQAYQKAFMSAKPILLEPIYKVEITVPEKYMGDVMGDLNSRRGRIQGIDPQGAFQVVRAEVPLAELYKYSTSLRSMTQGTGDYVMELSHYDPVPHEVAQKVIEAAQEEKEEVEA